MMFHTKTIPVPGAQLKTTIADMEEIWSEIDATLNEESTRMIHRDLFQLIGIIKGLMMSAELQSAPVEDAA
jgi:flagellin-specific chaperone FliS